MAAGGTGANLCHPFADLHPDPFYKYHSSVAAEGACHRGKGPAGAYGAETTDCDSPFSLINATFKWIDENVKDEIDFIIWTGDSARHDNDEQYPRDEKQITSLNKYTVSKFYEVFGNSDDDDNPLNDLTIPVVPTWGNNDILPHNIFSKGPNKWTKNFLEIWRNFIPESQRHGFADGGYFSVEVIPNKLAVFSLNSLYFFDSNSAVDGCASKKEPGYRQFEWLRIQLQFLRQRSMKAILIGHVPPARTDSKQGWDETCWQKYTLWNRQYRDVIVGSLWGHMNIDHFMLQDFEDVDIDSLSGEDIEALESREAFDDEISIQGTTDYLTDLRDNWASLPDPPKDFEVRVIDSKKGKKDKKKEKFFKKIGGEWGERFSLGLVSPSVVPNYFPSLRVFEYNISGIEESPMMVPLEEEDVRFEEEVEEEAYGELTEGNPETEKKKKKKRKFKIPKGPSKSTPPGPAYSPQTLTLLGYRQMYANLTVINNDFVDNEVGDLGWKDGNHPNKEPKENDKPNPSEFVYELEYDTRNDSIYKTNDLTVRNFIKLAARIGKYKPKKDDLLEDIETSDSNDDDIEIEEFEDKPELGFQKKHKHKKGKGKKRRAKNKVWFTFVKRAFVGSRDEDDLHETFGQKVSAIDPGLEDPIPPSWVEEGRWRKLVDEHGDDNDDRFMRALAYEMEL